MFKLRPGERLSPFKKSKHLYRQEKILQFSDEKLEIFFSKNSFLDPGGSLKTRKPAKRKITA
jgi:hypothetical protein